MRGAERLEALAGADRPDARRSRSRRAATPWRDRSARRADRARARSRASAHELVRRLGIARPRGGGDAHLGGVDLASRPRNRSSAAVVSMSRRPGTLRSRLSPSESSVAHRMGSAAFLAPLTRMVPSSFRAPRMRMASMMSLDCPSVPQEPLPCPRMLRAGGRACLASPCWARARRHRAEPVPSLDLRGFGRPPTRGPPLPRADGHAGTGRLERRRLALVRVPPDRRARCFRRRGRCPGQHQLSRRLSSGLGVGDRLARRSVAARRRSHRVVTTRRPSLGDGPPPTAALGDLAISTHGRRFSRQASSAASDWPRRAHLRPDRAIAASYLSEGASAPASSGCSASSRWSAIAACDGRSAGARPKSSVSSAKHSVTTCPGALGFCSGRSCSAWTTRDAASSALDTHGAIAVTPTFASKRRVTRGADLAGLARVRRRLARSRRRASARRARQACRSYERSRPRLGAAHHDEDNDGIDDEKDACPVLAEDKDGFEDGDGCPDFDNDDDGVADDDDRCPAELEDVDGFADEDGCPDLDDDDDGIPDEATPARAEAGVKNDDPETQRLPAERSRRRRHRRSARSLPEAGRGRDGFEDDDGCPDLDDDRDGVRDEEDACPRVAGARAPIRSLNGCPSPDQTATRSTTPPIAARTPRELRRRDDHDGCPESRPAPAARELRSVEDSEGRARTLAHDGRHRVRHDRRWRAHRSDLRAARARDCRALERAPRSRRHGCGAAHRYDARRGADGAHQVVRHRRCAAHTDSPRRSRGNHRLEGARPGAGRRSTGGDRLPRARALHPQSRRAARRRAARCRPPAAVRQPLPRVRPPRVPRPPRPHRARAMSAERSSFRARAARRGVLLALFFAFLGESTGFAQPTHGTADKAPVGRSLRARLGVEAAEPLLKSE